MDFYTWFSSQCSENDECPTLDIVVDHMGFCMIGWIFDSLDDDAVIVLDRDINPESSEKIYQVHHMWLDGGELDRRCSRSKSGWH